LSCSNPFRFNRVYNHKSCIRFIRNFSINSLVRRFVFKTLAAHAGVTTFPLPRFLLLLVVVVVMAFAPSRHRRPRVGKSEVWREEGGERKKWIWGKYDPEWPCCVTEVTSASHRLAETFAFIVHRFVFKKQNRLRLQRLRSPDSVLARDGKTRSRSMWR